jgi:hypothetical protein
VTLYRSFRTFTGPYVAHCHNLAHEDHNMMFGWEILPGAGDPAPDQSPLAGGKRDATPPPAGAGGGTPAGGSTAAGGAGGTVGGTTNRGDRGPNARHEKTVATLSCKLMRSRGRRVVRLKVSDSRGKATERLTIHLRHGGKDVAVFHRSVHRGRGTIDIPLSRTLEGRYDIVVVLDDRTTVRRTITVR